MEGTIYIDGSLSLSSQHPKSISLLYSLVEIAMMKSLKSEMSPAIRQVGLLFHYRATLLAEARTASLFDLCQGI